MPRVSVLIPCRDAAATAGEAFASIAEQTFRDLEIIAVDDGSTDDTASILARLAERDPRIRRLHNSGTGVANALSAGLASASGELIARMDADDIADPRRLERQLALLDAHSDIAACGTRVRYFPRRQVRDGARRYEAWINALSEPDDIARDVFVECPIAHPTLVIRRSRLDAVGGYSDRGWPEDYDLVLRLWRAGHRLANVPEVLLHWRERPDRLSRTDRRYDADAFRRCKAHHLARTHLFGRRALIIGAGPVGKAFARALAAEHVPVAAFVDIDPRKIGQTVHGAPVVAAQAVGRYRGAFALAAVGSAESRVEIRTWLTGNGWRDGDEFCAVA
ncbi:MAG: glycosyltransferase [Longimicrobiales bacterium]